MKLRILMAIACVAFVIPLFAQQEGTYLIHYFNSPAGAATAGGLNLTNTGSSIGLALNLTPTAGNPATTDTTRFGAVTSSLPGISNGDICANVYVVDPNQELIACCSCHLTPNSLASLTPSDLLSNTLTGVIPTSFSVKLVASVAGSSASGVPNGNCDAKTASTVGAIDNQGNPIGPPIATGLAAWALVTHGTLLTETAFTQGQLTNHNIGAVSPGNLAELQRLTSRCAAIVNPTLGSGFGICKSCTVGTL